MASIRIPEAIPSPRDVRHVVIVDIESSNVLLDRSNATCLSSGDPFVLGTDFFPCVSFCCPQDWGYWKH